MISKRPRHYAAEIMRLNNREERAAALAAVPEKFRSWVEHYVRDAFNKRNKRAA